MSLKAKMVIGDHLKDKTVKDKSVYRVRTLCLANKRESSRDRLRMAALLSVSCSWSVVKHIGLILKFGCCAKFPFGGGLHSGSKQAVRMICIFAILNSGTLH